MNIQDHEENEKSAMSDAAQSNEAVSANESLAQSTESASSNTAPSAESAKSMKEWLRGFVQIITQPEDLRALRGANVYKIYVSGALLLALGTTLSLWLCFINPELLRQSYECMKSVSKDAAQLPAPGAHFDFSQALGSSVLINGLVGYALMSGMLWLIHRAFTREPLEVLAFLGICSYTASISVLGAILNTICQYAFSSISAGFSLTSFVSYQDHPFIAGLLQRFDLFTVWAYVASALAVSGFLQRSRSYAALLATLGVLMHFLFAATITYTSYVVSQQVH